MSLELFALLEDLYIQHHLQVVVMSINHLSSYRYLPSETDLVTLEVCGGEAVERASLSK